MNRIRAKFQYGDEVEVKCVEGNPPNFRAVISGIRREKDGSIDYTIIDEEGFETDGYTEAWLSPAPGMKIYNENIEPKPEDSTPWAYNNTVTLWPIWCMLVIGCLVQVAMIVMLFATQETQAFSYVLAAGLLATLCDTARTVIGNLPWKLRDKSDQDS